MAQCLRRALLTRPGRAASRLLRRGSGEHRAELGDDAVGAVAVGLVDDVHVRDLENTGLERLDIVTETGTETTRTV